MLNNIVKKLNVSTKIIIVLLLTIMVIISKSIYFISFLTVLGLIIFSLSNKSVKLYINCIKNNVFWLLFSTILYIIIFGIRLELILFIYKLILVMVMFMGLLFVTNFSELNSGLYNMFRILKINENYSKKFSNFISLIVQLVKQKKDSRENIIKYQKIIGKNKRTIKNVVIPSLLMSSHYIRNFESSLKLKFYNPKKEKIKIIDILFIMFFTTLLLVAIIKEVLI